MQAKALTGLDGQVRNKRTRKGLSIFFFLVLVSSLISCTHSLQRHKAYYSHHPGTFLIHIEVSNIQSGRIEYEGYLLVADSLIRKDKMNKRSSPVEALVLYPENGIYSVTIDKYRDSISCVNAFYCCHYNSIQEGFTDRYNAYTSNKPRYDSLVRATPKHYFSLWDYDLDVASFYFKKRQWFIAVKAAKLVDNRACLCKNLYTDSAVSVAAPLDAGHFEGLERGEFIWLQSLLKEITR